MKAESTENGDFVYPGYASEKLDGWRCLTVDGIMYTSGGKHFKPNVQARFKPIIDAAKAANLVLDGELYHEGKQFGIISSTLSDTQEVMQERNLRFHCFDAITEDEWYGRSEQEPFQKRMSRYFLFGDMYDYEGNLFVGVSQFTVQSAEEADAFYAKIKAKGGEGIILRTFDGKYNPNTRSRDILKRKVWWDCSARVIDIKQQACPLKYAEEVKIEDGKEQGYKLTTGSVTVQILADQPLPAGTIQNATFTGAQSIELRKQFWMEREQMIGKIVDFEYLPGGSVAGRMARIFRIREDLE